MPICGHRQGEEAECGEHPAEEVSRVKVNDQVQARVGSRQEMDGW